MVPAPVNTVEIQQVRQRPGVCARIVDRHKLQFRPPPRRPQRQSANAAETVNTYFDLAHGDLLL